MGKPDIIYADEIVTPSTRPCNPQFALQRLHRKYAAIYGYYSNTACSLRAALGGLEGRIGPAEIASRESEAALEYFETLE
ncbi:hypothetical protein K8R33_03240 [archaeon]|nr:hypothetical protein [archaeon]